MMKICQETKENPQFFSDHKYKVITGVVAVTACAVAAYAYYVNRAVTEDELDDEATDLA